MPIQKNRSANSAARNYEKSIKNLKMVSYTALVLAILAVLISLTTPFLIIGGVIRAFNNISVAPAQNTSTFGHTLAGIDQPFNATQLTIINNAPNSYFEQAGLMYLNGSITNPIYSDTAKINQFVANNKTSVIYLGSITCIYCGENRWAMALALSRFGSFSHLFVGYSSLGDGDVPTIYWTQLNYNISSDVIGNYYSSPYVNFLSIEDTNPITGGFVLNSQQKMLSDLAQSNNATYIKAFQFILNLSNNKTTAFAGTPYTIWGTALFGGADASDFGNTTPTGTPEITYMTHDQILTQFSNPNDQFGWTEYTAADLYVAGLCNSISNSSQASVPACSIPAIRSIEAQLK